MSPELTQAVFFATMAVAILVWLVTLSLTLRIGQHQSPRDEFGPTDLEEIKRRFDTGIVTVPGTPATASKLLAKEILQTNRTLVGASYKIIDRSESHLHIEKIGPVACNQPAGTYFSSASFVLQRHGDRATDILYRLDFTRLAMLMRRIALGLVFGVGLPVLVLVSSLIWTLVVNSPNPAVRWQVLQTMQVAHAMWPPFLPISIYALGCRTGKQWIETLIAPLEHPDLTDNE